MDNVTSTSLPLCPSARPEMKDSLVFGVVVGTAENPSLAYLDELLPVTDELLALSQPLTPTEIFRVAASCIENACKHFDGSKCRLAKRIVEVLPTSVEILPPCRIRSKCRWWQQEGKAACMRCSQIVTDDYSLNQEHQRLINNYPYSEV
jgi:hypothetical protein